MPKVGDRVVIEGNKVGQQRREGSLVELAGSLIKVRWTDGSESLMTPGAGAVRFLPGSGRSSGASSANATPAAGRKPVKASPERNSVKGSAKRAKAPGKTIKKTAKSAKKRGR